MLPTVLEPQGGEVLVNTYTSGDQHQPSVTALADGGYVVTWISNGQDGSGYGIYAQRYDAGGAAVGGEARVNTYTTGEQFEPWVTALADGGYLVSWHSYLQDGSGYGIYAQRYDAAGAAQGGEFQVNAFTVRDQYWPSACGLADGGYVVTWMSDGQDGNSWAVIARRYDASGTAVGGEVQVNTYTAGAQYSPAIAALADGGYVISWNSDGQDGSSNGTYAQRYDASGVAQGGEVQVNTYTNISQGNSSVAPLADGGYVITWTSEGQDGSTYGVFSQRYDASGVAQGAEIQVNTYVVGSQINPSVTALSDGGHVVTWASNGQDGSARGVYAQRYDALGAAVGGELQINTYTNFDQFEPSVTALADGGFVVSWTSYGQDGSGYGVYTQRYVPNFAPTAPADGDTANANTLQENAIAGAVTGVTVASTDAEGDTISYTLADDAGGRFAIDAATGAITAGTTPIDYETAFVDELGNHYYEVTATASDGTSESDSTTFRILVTNQVENPFTGASNGSLAAPINFNAMPDGAYDFTDARYSALGGSDHVILPDIATVDAGNPWDFAMKFHAGAGDDRVQGGTGDDFVDGGAGGDWLFGGDGNDKLVGGTGRDILVGGGGSDRLTGSGDADIFVFTDSELATTPTGEHDTVTDFQKGSDKLDLSALYDSHAIGSISAGSAAAGAAVSGYGIIYNVSGSRTFIYGDTDGIAGADFVIELSGKIKLTAADLITTTGQWSAATGGLDHAPLHNDLFWV